MDTETIHRLEKQGKPTDKERELWYQEFWFFVRRTFRITRLEPRDGKRPWTNERAVEERAFRS